MGHTRSTQTKGVWVWGEPQLAAGSQPSTEAVPAIVYVDTEGFESTGKSDVYDDRIFALSTIISSLLVYNLPETVRESDVEKLSFAVQLAEGFYASSQASAASTCYDGVLFCKMAPLIVLPDRLLLTLFSRTGTITCKLITADPAHCLERNRLEMPVFSCFKLAHMHR